MGEIYVNGTPLADVNDKKESKPKREKFIKLHNRKEVQITACAVSKMAGVDCLPDLEEYKDYLVEPNHIWLLKQPDPFACVKVYYKINTETDSVIIKQVQMIKIPMPFLGEDYNECWAEVQFIIKRTIQGDKFIWARLGRHQSYDKRVERWVTETKPIIPKKDLGTHGYISLRLYHQNHLPEVPGDWHFEPVYAVIDSRNFYRIDASWKDEEITIIATLLDNSSSEIPSFLRQ